MAEIAHLSQNQYAKVYHGSRDFLEMMDMLDKRLNDSGKNWRNLIILQIGHVYKVKTC